MRHTGSKESWAGKDTELAAAKEAWKKKGFDYYLDEETNMYKIKPIEQTAPVVTEKPVGDTGTDPLAPKKQTVQTPVKPEKKKFSWEMDPNLKFGLPRAMYADFMNRKMTDLMKETPILQNPFEYHRTVQSDLNAEM
jgi:hypothetical protein